MVSELCKALDGVGREPPLFHFRDASGHQVDVVIDPGARLSPLEVEAGITVASDSLRNLQRRCALADNPHRAGVLVHGGAERWARRGHQILPWFPH